MSKQKLHTKLRTMWSNMPESCEDCDDFSETELELCADCADLLDGIIHGQGDYVDPEYYSDVIECQCCEEIVEGCYVYAKS